MRARLLWLVWCGCLSACNRPEEIPSSPPVRSASAAEAKQHDPAPAVERCWVETPAEPPPSATVAASCPVDPAPAPALPRANLTFVDAPGRPTVEVELARNDVERSRGLMFRTSMPADSGMLFSWHDERVRSFWMRNTCIPLDMLFIARDGYIVGVLEQVPTLNEDSRSIPCPAAHVLELNAGWARRHGVKAGQRVQLP